MSQHLPPPLPLTEPSAEFDLLTDALLPAALFVMLGSLIWFLIDVRATMVGGPTSLLRWIFFFFLLAVVGIARIKAREGRFDAAPFAIGLLLVMGLFGFLYNFGGGAFGEGFGGGHPVAALLAHYALIAAIWFGGHYVVEQTAIDPQNVELQEAGLLSSEEWAARGAQAEAVRRRPHPGRAVMVLSAFAVLIFGLGHELVSGQETQVHSFWCMVVFLGSALAVLAMSALAGLEVYVRGRGTRLPANVVGTWLLLALPLAALLLLGAGLLPAAQPAPNVNVPWMPDWLGHLGQPGDRAAPWASEAPTGSGPGRGQGPGQGGGTQPGGQAGQGRQGQRGQGQGNQPGPRPGGEQQGAGAGRDSTKAGGPRPDAQPKGSAKGDAQRQPPAPDQAQSAPEKGTPRAADKGEPKSSPDAQDSRQPPSPPPPPAVPPTPWEDLLKPLLATLGVVLLGALGWLAARALRRLGRAGRPADPDAPVVTRNPFVDPFAANSPFRGRPAAEVVVHVYRAFQAYGALVGKPRRADLTAYEYLRDLPPIMVPWRDRIEQLTDLYVAVEYTPASVDDSCLSELRSIWERLMQAVREART